MLEKYEQFAAFSPPWVDFTQILKEKQNGPNKYHVLTITLMEEQKQQLKISVLSFCVFQETKHHEYWNRYYLSAISVISAFGFLAFLHFRILQFLTGISTISGISATSSLSAISGNFDWQSFHCVYIDI